MTASTIGPLQRVWSDKMSCWGSKQRQWDDWELKMALFKVLIVTCTAKKQASLYNEVIIIIMTLLSRSLLLLMWMAPTMECNTVVIWIFLGLYCLIAGLFNPQSCFRAYMHLKCKKKNSCHGVHLSHFNIRPIWLHTSLRAVSVSCSQDPSQWFGISVKVRNKGGVSG